MEIKPATGNKIKFLITLKKSKVFKINSLHFINPGTKSFPKLINPNAAIKTLKGNSILFIFSLIYLFGSSRFRKVLTNYQITSKP